MLYNHTQKKYQSSTLSIIIPDKKLQVFDNGYYSPAPRLKLKVTLAWEKIGDMLPLDYISTAK